MSETIAPATKMPWHLWLVGVLAVLWNMIGALDFFMTEFQSDAYLNGMTAEQQAVIHAFPLWAVSAWGAGTWGGFLGSSLLLLRRAWAVPLFAASVAGVILTDLYSYVLSDWMKVMKGGPGAVVFSGVIFIVAVLLLLYAGRMRARGALR